MTSNRYSLWLLRCLITSLSILLMNVVQLPAVPSAQAQVPGDGESGGGKISGDGQKVVFSSTASNLALNDDDTYEDIFLWDRASATVSLVSDWEGQYNEVYDAEISSDGTTVAYTNFAGIFIKDLATGANSELGGTGSFRDISLTATGEIVAFASNASDLVANDPDMWDVFVRDRATGDTERVSVSSSGSPADGGSYSAEISDDGRYVAFESDATNLVSNDTNATNDVFLHDRAMDTTTRISVGDNGAEPNGASLRPSLSHDGRYVVFRSRASNLVPGDTNGQEDVFLHDRILETTIRVATQGYPYGSYSASISSTGANVAFDSVVTNLVANDTNAYEDVFVFDVATQMVERVSVDSLGHEGNHASLGPDISSSGQEVVFDSFASNLVPGDTNGAEDVFFHDRLSGETIRVSAPSTSTDPDPLEPQLPDCSTPEPDPTSMSAEQCFYVGTGVLEDPTLAASKPLKVDCFMNLKAKWTVLGPLADVNFIGTSWCSRSIYMDGLMTVSDAITGYGRASGTHFSGIYASQKSFGRYWAALFQADTMYFRSDFRLPIGYRWAPHSQVPVTCQRLDTRSLHCDGSATFVVTPPIRP